jgi:hypothetical protein
MAVIRFPRSGERPGRVAPVRCEGAKALGAAFTAGGRLWCVLAVDRPAGGDRKAALRYVLPGAAAQTRHLVTGLGGGAGYAVTVRGSRDGQTVVVSPDGPVRASPHGSLLFDLAPDGDVRPVKTQSQKDVVLPAKGATREG